MSQRRRVLSCRAQNTQEDEDDIDLSVGGIDLQVEV
jgi:hypothetical protein